MDTSKDGLKIMSCTQMRVCCEYFFTSALSLFPCSDLFLSSWLTWTRRARRRWLWGVSRWCWRGTLKKAVMLYQYSLMACSVPSGSWSQQFCISSANSPNCWLYAYSSTVVFPQRQSTISRRLICVSRMHTPMFFLKNYEKPSRPRSLRSRSNLSTSSSICLWLSSRKSRLEESKNQYCACLPILTATRSIQWLVMASINPTTNGCSSSQALKCAISRFNSRFFSSDSSRFWYWNSQVKERNWKCSWSLKMAKSGACSRQRRLQVRSKSPWRMSCSRHGHSSAIL